jgi:hypothetical protein
VADELGILDDRPSWTVAGDVATYTPVPAGWHAKIFRLRHPGRGSYSRYHISVLDPAGLARYVFQASSVAEAVRVAEGHASAAG